eukprot:PLAT15613.1.p1 GENE.PLAT15613.1~~PLAT15613.1.p1  ORF type:complete len:1097 (+),score=370.23 PLAT15613.1:409-3291(+)
MSPKVFAAPVDGDSKTEEAREGAAAGSSEEKSGGDIEMGAVGKAEGAEGGDGSGEVMVDLDKPHLGLLLVVDKASICALEDHEAETLEKLNDSNIATPRQARCIIKRIQSTGLYLEQDETEDKVYMRLYITELDLMIAAEAMAMWKRLKPMHVASSDSSDGEDGEGTSSGSPSAHEHGAVVDGGYLPFSFARAGRHRRPAKNVDCHVHSLITEQHRYYPGIFRKPDRREYKPSSMFSYREKVLIILWKLRSQADLDVVWDGETAGGAGRLEQWDDKPDGGQWPPAPPGLLIFSNISPVHHPVHAQLLMASWVHLTATPLGGGKPPLRSRFFSPWYAWMKPPGVKGSPWNQPLFAIKEYYGERTGLYFAFIGHLIAWMCLPAAFGIITFGTQSTFSAEPTSTSDSPLVPVYSLLLLIWATLFMESWKRRNFELALHWGVDDYVEPSVFRKDWLKVYEQHFGTDDPEEVMEVQAHALDAMWIERVENADGGKSTRLGHRSRNSCSMFVVVTFMALVLTVIISILVLRLTVRTLQAADPTNALYNFGVFGAGLLNGISIQVMGALYNRVARALTRWENHRTTIEHENALIIKTFAFQFVNNYTSLFYIAFIKKHASPLMQWITGQQVEENCANNDCMRELAVQLTMILAVKSVMWKVLAFIIPWAKRKWQVWRSGKKQEEKLWFKAEDELPEYSGVTGDYSEVAIMYGYITLFAAAFPLAPVLSVLTSLIELRADARTMRQSKRIFPEEAANIGSWQLVFQFITWLSILTNLALITLTSNQLLPEELPLAERVVLIILLEHVIVLLRAGIMHAVPDKAASSFFRLYREGEKYTAIHTRIKYRSLSYATYVLNPQCIATGDCHVAPGLGALSTGEMTELKLDRLLLSEERLRSHADGYEVVDEMTAALDARGAAAESPAPTSSELFSMVDAAPDGTGRSVYERHDILWDAWEARVKPSGEVPRT